ncbi:MAG: hypothetical protein KIT46_04635 [Anaerolineales bacterium]|nr:hypothetical protein [Anaerolineales bacterium]MCW5855317.1 hypothetical protein [Anaerolineales bacterium]
MSRWSGLHPHARHARRRAKQRYGASAADVRTLEGCIHMEAGIVRRLQQSHNRMLYEIRALGRSWYAIYSRRSQLIVTLLAPQDGERLFARAEETPRCEICGCMLANVRNKRWCTVCWQERR